MELKMIFIDHDSEVFDREIPAWVKRNITAIRAHSVQEAIMLLNGKELYVGVIINGDNVNYAPALTILRDIAPNMPIHIVMESDSNKEINLATSMGATWVHVWQDTPDETADRLLYAIQEKRSEFYNSSRDSLKIFIHKNLMIIPEKNYRFVFKDDRKIQIIGREFDVLNYIFQERGKLCQTEKMLADLWGDKSYDVSAVTRAIHKVNQKLLPDKFIENERGQGYRFVI